METAKDLSETTLFNGLDNEQLSAIAGIATSAEFGPDEVVYESGSVGDSMYMIVKGAFTVRVVDENGEQVDVATLRTGSYFGEMEVIGGINRTASIVSAEESRCYRFDAAALLSLLKQNAPLAAQFYREVCKGLILRLKNTTRDMGYFKVRAT
jgi:CRP-like cAMP-binding protein